ncbi:MAG TPA: hypothetical protein VMS98_07170 [Thermoanaerobaculia bacterium]|nr:hypothetical protein [Thermoanaerobaculia bacterium]
MAPATDVQEKATDPAVTVLPPAGEEIDGAVVGQGATTWNVRELENVGLVQRSAVPATLHA